MADVSGTVTKLESALRDYGNAFEVLHYLTTMDERGKTLYQALVEVEELVENLNDSRLKSHYQRLISSQRSQMPN